MVVPQGEAVKHSPQKSGATLRQATIFALDTLIAFSKNAHEESCFGDISSSEEKVRKMASRPLEGIMWSRCEGALHIKEDLLLDIKRSKFYNKFIWSLDHEQ